MSACRSFARLPVTVNFTRDIEGFRTLDNYAYPAFAVGLMSEPIVCPDCGRTLGELREGRIVIRHQGRVVLAQPDGVEAIGCDRCAGIWRAGECPQEAA
jgi:hypothetical protein